jgi:hypothetical protein
MTQAVEIVRERPALSRAASAVLIIAGGLAWTVAIGTILFLGPFMGKWYGQFDIPGGLPWLTQLFIDVGWWLNGSWPLVAGAGVFALGLACTLPPRRGPGASVVFASVSLIAVPIIMGLMMFAMCLPLLRTMFRIGGTP